MKNLRALAILNVISFMSQIAVVVLTQQKIISSSDVGEVSSLYSNLFTPAAFTFAIWGIIYTGLGIFCLYHLVMAYKRNRSYEANRDLHLIGGLFIINNIATACWLIAWTKLYLGIALLLIIIQLITLILIHKKLHIHQVKRSPGGKLATEFPISLYFGWITIATIANASTYLQSINWTGFGISPQYWAIIMLVIATILGLTIAFFRHNIIYGLVFIWGIFGIISRLKELDTSGNKMIILTGWICISLLSLVTLIQIIRSFVPNKKAAVL